MAEQIGTAVLKKISAVMEVVNHIEKRGQNKMQNYDYLMAEDVLAEVRAEFVKQGLVLLPACVSQDVIEGQTKSGTASYLTRADLEYTVADIETGETVTLKWQGQGQDTGDKGLYKAFTGGNKYFLRNLLMIPTGDDPENDGTAPKPRQQRAQQPRQQPAQSGKPAPAPSKPAPAVDNEAPHPNKNPDTTKACQAIYVEAKKKGLTNEQVREIAAKLTGKEIATLYDLGTSAETYREVYRAVAALKKEG